MHELISTKNPEILDIKILMHPVAIMTRAPVAKKARLNNLAQKISDLMITLYSFINISSMSYSEDYFYLTILRYLSYNVRYLSTFERRFL